MNIHSRREPVSAFRIKYNALYFALPDPSLRLGQAGQSARPTGLPGRRGEKQMKAVCRVAKVKGAGSIGGKSDHNYRQGHVPNADAERKHLNHEYVLNYENLAKAIDARLHNVGLDHVRKDAVKGMEFILTASPEAFKRDQTGQFTGDYRESDWLKANLNFMKQQYGSNLVAFTLHQDEKTPHIHAIVVPITPDNRLCAKELFTPKTLRQLQTDYAAAMKPFGLERGIEGSRAQHVDMKHIYGLQQAQRQEIQQELTPIQQENQPLHVSKPDVLDLLNLERWRQQQEAQINAEYNRRLAEVQKAAQIAQNAAVANATAKEQGKVLQQRLDTAEGLKQVNHEKAQQTGQQLTQANQNIERIAVLVDENRLDPKWSQQTAERVRERVLPQLEKAIAESVKKIKSGDFNEANQQLRQSLEKQGYEFKKMPDGKTSLMTDPKSGVQLNIATAKFEGKSLRELVTEHLEKIQKQELKQSQQRNLGLSR